MASTDEFAWKDLTVIVGGKDVGGIRGVSWKESQVKEFIYGKGDEPIGIGKGNKEPSIELKMTLGEKLALEKSLGVNSLLDVSFDVSLAYAKEQTGKQAFRYFKSVEITEDAEAFEQGDTSMEVTFPAICLGIKRS
ncbi:hypothetical protein [Flammeovirga aprica]|uniref:Uncharacterized protein n=1 Tax=Flammeovirga aprica JL-4 TaxID=694437 RepID=A0A7X9RUM0_9BACT|nr:hypothetical protein [Flammeovirga aprica]NME69008.1 hypothetical protein [Flammeovirga aprica JL-4]